MQQQINYKTLLVDDDPKILSMLKMNLELNGFCCQTTTNPNEVISSANSFTPDIIISDLMMPEIDGYALRKKIMADKKLKDIPFIFLTSLDDENKILQGFDMNVEDYVLKTTSSRVLTQKVISVIKSKEKFKNALQVEINEKTLIRDE